MATRTKEAGRKLIVSYFPRSASAAELRGVFEQHGYCVQDVRIVRDSNGASRCYGFVDFHSIHDTNTALGACKRGEVRLVDENLKTWYLKADIANCLQSKCSRGVLRDANKKKSNLYSCARNPNAASIDSCGHDFVEDEIFFKNLEDSRNHDLLARHYVGICNKNNTQEHHLRDPCLHYFEEDYISDVRAKAIFERRCSDDDRREHTSDKRYSGDDKFGNFRNQHLPERHKTNTQEHHLRDPCHNNLRKDYISDACMSIIERQFSGDNRREYNEGYVEDLRCDDAHNQQVAGRHYAVDSLDSRVSKATRFIHAGKKQIPETDYLGRSHTTLMLEGVLLRDPPKTRLAQDDRFLIRRNRYIPKEGNFGTPCSNSILAAGPVIVSRMEYVSTDHDSGGFNNAYAPNDDFSIHPRDQCGIVDSERLTSIHSEGNSSLGDFAVQGHSQNSMCWGLASLSPRSQQSESLVVTISL